MGGLHEVSLYTVVYLMQCRAVSPAQVVLAGTQIPRSLSFFVGFFVPLLLLLFLGMGVEGGGTVE